MWVSLSMWELCSPSKDKLGGLSAERYTEHIIMGKTLNRSAFYYIITLPTLYYTPFLLHVLLDLEFCLPMLLLVDRAPTRQSKTPSTVIHPIEAAVGVHSVTPEVLKQGDQGSPQPTFFHTTWYKTLYS